MLFGYAIAEFLRSEVFLNIFAGYVKGTLFAGGNLDGPRAWE